MSFQSFDDEQESINEINMTPLVDVMLVLLIVFMITIPVLNHSVDVKLPQASSTQAQPQPASVDVAVDAQGRYYWNDAALDDTALAQKLAAAAAQHPQPELRLRADRNVRYERVAQLMAAARSAGIDKLGFVTAPAR